MTRTTIRSAGLLAFLLAASVASAGVVRVESYGVDSDACGSKQDPCRSIGRAIDRSAEGDAILVGPGFYGDLDADGVLGEAGEEGADAATCDCLVLLDRRVEIRSTAGAAATLLRDGGAAYAFHVTAAGAVLGRRNRGFTIVGSAQVSAPGVRVEGDVLLGGFLAFETSAPGGVAADARFFGPCAGFSVFGTGSVVQRSAVALCDVGVYAEAEPDVPVRVEDSVFAGNRIGLHMTGTGTSEVSRVTIAGNAEYGGFQGEGAAATRVNVLGNGTVLSLSPGELNCGFFGEALDVTASFWGSPAGPGGDPADQVCEIGAAPALVAPVAPKEIRVKLKPLR